MKTAQVTLDWVRWIKIVKLKLTLVMGKILNKNAITSVYFSVKKAVNEQLK